MTDVDPHRLTEHAILSSLVTTLRTQVVPALDDAWTRSTVIQLAALAALLRDRPDDPSELRAAELADVLAQCDVDLDATSYASVLRSCSVALGGWDEDDPRRARLRAVLIAHLAEDLDTNMGLLAAFRGQMPDA